MNIAYCTDNQYDLVEICMCSLLENNKGQECFIYLFTTNITIQQEKRFQHIANYYNSYYKTILVDLKLLPFLDNINDENGMHKGLCALLPDSAYYRWLIPYYLHDKDKCLYLDTDVIVNKDLSLSYNTNINGYAICGGQCIQENEINSGSLLINIPYWNDNDVLRQCIEMIESNVGGKINDQHILNKVVCNNRMFFEEQYMALSCHIMCNDDISNYTLFHYCGTYRPWLLEGGKIWKNTYYWWNAYDTRNRIVK